MCPSKLHKSIYKHVSFGLKNRQREYEWNKACFNFGLAQRKSNTLMKIRYIFISFQEIFKACFNFGLAQRKSNTLMKIRYIFISFQEIFKFSFMLKTLHKV
jgi:hypothetical protein